MNPRTLSLAGLTLALLSMAATCEQCQQASDPRIGNVDRTTDAVLVNGSDGHSYLVSAHPELEHLRVLDLTTERFVDAPNRFFPASVPTGPSTRRLAAAATDGTRVYALDGDLDRLQVVRTVDDEGPSFSLVGNGVDTGRAPADLAVFSDGATVEAWLTLPDATPEGGVVQVLSVDVNTDTDAEVARVVLPAGARPSGIDIEPTGQRVVVTDAALHTVHVLRRAERTLDRSLDVGGPSAQVAAGVVDVGDGLAPVALVSRLDDNEVAALRLFREGYREDGAVVLGRAELPHFPMALYVPDHRASTTVCCRGLDDDAIDAGEATDSWAAAALASGDVLYLALSAPTPQADRAVVRLIDDEVAGLGGLVDLNTEPALWVPTAGGEDRRPIEVTLTPRDTYGDPPFVPLVASDEVPLCTWEGAPPGLGALAGSYLAGDFSGSVDAAALGARVGDVAVFTVADLPAQCAGRTLEAPITALAGTTLSVARGDGGLDADDETCIAGGAGTTVAVLAAQAFVVELLDGSYAGRLNLVDGDAGNELFLPGAALTMKAAAVGLPLRGSMLSLPLQPNLEPLGLALADTPSSLGAGGFGSAGLLPMTLVGGEMDIPDAESGSTQRVRRMVIGTASPGSTSGLAGLYALFACDEAETTPNLCLSFR